MGGFWQLSFDLGSLDPLTAEQSCFDCGAVAVTFADAGDDPVLEPLPGEFRLWPATRLRALFPHQVQPDSAGQKLRSALHIPADALQWEHVEDRLWEREWLRDFHAMRFGRRLWVCPRHEQVREPGAVVVTMDPGLAFGTGTHPTTALCLEWLDQHLVAGERLIDYGCGSGILAIAALKLGALEAHCFDIDPQALLAAAENARVNDVEARIRISPSVDNLPEKTDVLVANILSGPLRDLATAFASLVRPGGAIALAGLMDHETADVTQAYSAWFDIHPFEIRDGWVGLAGKRNTHAPRASSMGAGRS